MTWAIVPTAALLFVSQSARTRVVACGDVRRRCRHRRDGAGGARPAHVDRVLGRGGAPRPPARARAGVARRRGARARRRAVHRQDRHAHRGSTRARSDRAASTRISTPSRSLAALAAADPAPNATLRAIARGAVGDGAGWTSSGHRAVLVGAEVGRRRLRGARRVGARRARTCSRDRGVGARRGRDAGRPGARVVLLARAAALDGDAAPGRSRPGGARRARRPGPCPTPAETLRYFAEQEVLVKVLRGDAPATVGAIASGLGLEGAGTPSTHGACPTTTRCARRRAGERTACSAA